jgi:clan AA aspartic protease (TIGR02281 family)
MLHSNLTNYKHFRLVMALVFSAGLLAGCGGTGPRASVDALLPLAQVGQHIVATVQVNGQDARFMIDTGASHIAMTERLAKQLALAQQAAVRGTGAAAAYQAKPVVLNTLQLGNAREDGMTAFVIPVPEDFFADGLVGNAFFEPYIVTVDYQAKTLRLQTPDTFIAPVGMTPLPIQRRGQLILVPATLDGHPGLCQIDTGAGNAITVLRPAADALGLREQYKPTLHTLSGRSAGGDTYGDIVRLPKVELGEHEFTRVVAELSLAQSGFFSLSGILCNVGQEVLRRFQLIIDYPGKRLFLIPNAQYAEPFVYQRAGASIGIEQGMMTALFVLPGGPAEEAGLKAGDRIEQINTLTASEMTSDRLAVLMRGNTGTTLRLLVNRKGSESTWLQLVLRDLL